MIMLCLKIKNMHFSNKWITNSIKLIISHRDTGCQKSTVKIKKLDSTSYCLISSALHLSAQKIERNYNKFDSLIFYYAKM